MAEENVTEKLDDEKRTLTIFGPETEFDGVLEFSDDLIITGKFNGRIKATGNLEIAKGAVCTVEKMTAKSIVISGSVTSPSECVKFLNKVFCFPLVSTTLIVNLFVPCGISALNVTVFPFLPDTVVVALESFQ